MSSELHEERRLFIAVMLPEDIREQLAAQMRLLDAHSSILRPVKPEALHFTLRFLGNQSAAQEEKIRASCAAAVVDSAAFPLVIGGFGVFPDARRPRVVWLGLREGDEPLVQLQRRIDDELLARGVVERREPFTPHLTLARVRAEASPAAKASLGSALSSLSSGEDIPCTADAVSLVHSVLNPKGSIYTVLERWPLHG